MGNSAQFLLILVLRMWIGLLYRKAESAQTLWAVWESWLSNHEWKPLYLAADKW